MPATENEKRLRINYGRCTRCVSEATPSLPRLEKEIACYIKEREEEKKKLEDMKSNHADEYDVKQMVCLRCRTITHRKR